MLKTEELKLVSEWDKTFPQSEKVDHKKVTFVNRYGITLAADLYKPKNVSGKYPAIAVSGPFGAVKEQCSGLYAQTMAEKGYLTIAFIYAGIRLACEEYDVDIVGGDTSSSLTGLAISITCIGEDAGRLPPAHPHHPSARPAGDEYPVQEL